MTQPAPDFRAVNQHTGEVADGPMTIPTLIPDALLTEINSLRLQLEEAGAESANIAALFAETERHNGRLATELAHALSDRNDVRDKLHDMAESRDMWADRAETAETAERELARLQNQSVRIEELKAECAEWAQGFATAVNERDAARFERDTYRAAVSAVAR
jgi:chromosome segregation ATPase